MSSPVTAWLIHALIVVGLSLFLWSVITLPLLWIKGVLEAAGVYAFPGRVAQVARRLGVDGGALARFFQHADASMLRNGDHAAVRVVLDERHAQLRARLQATEVSVREAVNTVQGLAGYNGDAGFLGEIAALRERTRVVEQVGLDLEYDVREVYPKREAIKSQLFLLVPFAFLISLANGALLNVLFSEMTSMRIFGVLPMSYVFGIVVVALEALLGVALYRFRTNPLMMIMLALFVLVATTFEAFAMSIFSVEFATSLRGADITDAKIQDHWMVLLAVVFTPMTAILGYMLEEARAQNAELKGMVRLADELKACNQFVEGLPMRWTSIEQKARNAEAAIGRYQDALGGREDRLAGSIEAIAAERQALSDALFAAKIDEWPTLLPGREADHRHAAVQNILLCLLTVCGFVVYAAGVGYLFARAGEGAWPTAVCVAAGIGAALLLLIAGNMAFGRLRLVQGENGRAQPMSSSGYQKAVAGALLAGCAAGIIWACVAIIGAWGLIVGTFVTALGGALCFLGYGLERAGRGLVLLVSLAAGFSAAASAVLFSTVRYGLLWLLAAIAWIAGFAVWVLARPAEVCWDWYKKRGARVTGFVVEAAQ